MKYTYSENDGWPTEFFGSPTSKTKPCQVKLLPVSNCFEHDLRYFHGGFSTSMSVTVSLLEGIQKWPHFRLLK